MSEDKNYRLGSGTDSQQLYSSGEENIYNSEEHRQIYQGTAQSFDEQRDQYAEQPLNSPLPYDYQSSANSESEDSSVVKEEFQRYVSDIAKDTLERVSSASLPFDGDNNNAADSIFSASDYELASGTENYLPQNSKRYEKKIEKHDKKLRKARQCIEDLEKKKLSYSREKSRLITDPEKEKLFKKRTELQYSWERKQREIHVVSKRQFPGRLKFETEKTALSEKEHRKAVRRKEKLSFKKERRLKSFYYDAKNFTGNDEFQEDELDSELKRKSKKAAGNLEYTAKHNIRKIKREFNGYSRLRFQNARLDSLHAQKARLSYKSGIDLQKREAKEAARQQLLREKSKRKLKKEMVQNYKRAQGNFFVRNWHQHQLKKTVRKERRMAIKRIRVLVSSLLAILIILAILILLIVFFMFIFLETGSESYANSTSQNTYYDMTDVTAYFREMEADLAETILPENLEPIILGEDPDIYEFVYDMADISFDANTLVAYLSAKYNEFDLDMVKSDLEEIFNLYYTLSWEIKEEDREVPDESQPPDPDTGEYPLITKKVKICYIKLEKADFYELLESQIPDSAKQEQMSAFYITGNGQQIYGPVMYENWRNKISSNYGWRVHPITGVRTFHDGVDIAVPTGTALYSAVTGTVVSSQYSDSAGNMVTIQNSSGWQITFMHMDSRTVQAGDEIEQGQLVGYSGNTGNSTGPHLHLRVHDAEGNPINPVFIIPFSTIEASETN